MWPAPVQEADRAGAARRAMWDIGQARRRTLSASSTGPLGCLSVGLSVIHWHSRFGEMPELLDHPLVGLALERHDQVGKILHRLPAPRDEFRLVAARGVLNVDLAVVSGEAQREPFLRLAAIFSLPRPAEELARDVVTEPVVDRRQMLDRADVGLLVQLAQPARVWVFAGIEPALRHLPGMGHVDVLWAVAAPPDEDEPAAVEHRQADARTIGQVFEAGHGIR